MASDSSISMTIRRARAGDEAMVLGLLRSLAQYEKLLDRFLITEREIARDYLGEDPLIHAEMAFMSEECAGVATWYWAYASFAAKRVIFLEDFFVRSELRGKGCGKALLAHLARIATKHGAEAIEWRVLDWNKPSIDFYEGLHAKRSTDWHVYSLSGEALEDLADR